MDPTDWTKLELLFEAALALEGEERVRFIDDAAAGDDVLRAELNRLIASYGSAPDYFASMRRHLPGGEPPSVPRGPLRPGVEVNQYHIERELGAGGMGVVYLARDQRLDRPVALKFLPEIRREGAEQRFLQEARAASRLDHPHICTVYEFGETGDGIPYIAMAYYEGETLKARMRRGLDWDEALVFARQMLEGLAHAHEQGIVHRDIKPDNLMIASGGVIKILDFGLAKVRGVDLTRTGTTMGTVAYMCPEQARGGAVDHRSDIWSAGVVMYEMATGARPFAGDYDQAVLYAILHEDPAPPSTHRADLPAGLDDVILRCLEKDPERRFQRAQDVLDALELKATSPLPATQPPAPSMRRKISLRHLVYAAMAVVVLVIGGMLWQRGASHNAVDTVDAGADRLVVLPFTSAGVDSALVAGLAYTTANRLGLMERYGDGWTSITPDERDAEEVISAADAFRRLGATRAVLGEARAAGAGLQLTMHLVDTRSERPLETRAVDVTRAELGRLDGRIVETLAALLDIPLTTSLRELLSSGTSLNPQAYNDYTRALGYLQHYEDASNLDASINLFELAIKEDPDFTLAYAGLGEAYILKYELDNQPAWVDEAVRYGQQAVALDENLGPVRLTMGMIYLKTGDYAEAERQFLRAYVLDGENAEAQYQLARVYTQLGDLRQAESFYRQAITLRPEAWGYALGLGNFYSNQGRHEEAIPLYETVIRLRPRNPWGYNNLGVQLQELDRIDEALDQYQQAATANPSARAPTALAYYNIGVIHYARDAFAEAAAYFRRSVDLLETDLDVWQDLGTAYYYLGRQDSANQAWEKVLNLADGQLQVNPVDSWALWHQAFARAKLGNAAGALQSLERLLSQENVSASTLLNAAKCYEVLGDRDRALDFVGRAFSAGLAVRRVEVTPWLDTLRQDPRYATLAASY